MPKTSSRIAIFLNSLGGGGAELAMINLACGLIERGLEIDLIAAKKVQSSYLFRIPSEVRIIDLEAPIVPASLPAMVRYLRQEKPLAMLSALHYSNEVALLAKRLARVKTRVVVCEHNNLSKNAQGQISERFTPWLAKCFYPWADDVVTVSRGVAKDVADLTGLPLEQIRVIYNPVVTPDLSEKAKELIDHPWFTPGEPPVLLGAGRLVPQKDFPTLIRAFAQVRQVKQARLVILGVGPERNRLGALVQELGLEGDVAMPGFVQNPYAYMARAAAFVLSSAWEGFGNVLVEAMAMGTPVISTDCESGPAEILDNGRYGLLTPVGDSKALAEAILSVLSGNLKPIAPTWLKQFTLEAATQDYLAILGVQTD